MKKLSRLLAVVATTILCLTAVPGPAEAAWVNPLPRPMRFAPLGEDSSFPAAFARTLVQPNRNPIGANDWSCRPSSRHPVPVVLVHGTWENAYNNWNGLSPVLKDQGYCVFALNYGNSTGIAFLNGTGDMIASAQELAPFVDRVRAATGASKVDLIGHSQGGAVARYYANKIGGAAKVDQVIGIAPSNHPTTLSGITELGKTLRLFGLAMGLLELVDMPAAQQQADKSPAPQSPFYRQLNDAGETVPGIDYTVIATQYDEVVTPWERAYIQGGGSAVDNIRLQDVCPIDLSEHVSITYSKNVAQIVMNALDPTRQHRVWCYPQAPLTGNMQLIG
ncbi:MULTISPECIES: lipase family alpha/beta hydrolase [Mumia]|uniref:lipase family alpha/beta hydrolase n=1 Tax=Mumia TaxID=1546255 RepID=UPI0014236105|nr:MULTISPECIES: alpha/beta fold hydrolase [unclassified Mumia]QMW65592.1 alpha/beta fold hydrolase [Mumia sp. ZJ1417]